MIIEIYKLYQIHILDDGSIQVFSRNSENNTSKYPDIIESLKTILKLSKNKEIKNYEEEQKQVRSAIVDAEVVAYDIENKVILPFQVLSTRKRKVLLKLKKKIFFLFKL